MAHPLRIDLNSDLGEFSDPDRMKLAEQVLAHVTSVNIACGFHAGNPDLMRWTVRYGRDKGAAVGAHPGFRDREHFGRREIEVSPAEVENLVAYQVGALVGIAALEGVRLSHVKPHGALYGLAARDETLAEAFARAVVAIDRRLILVGLAGSKLVQAGRSIGLTVAEEAFADRAYNHDGTLVPRDHAGAVICSTVEVLSRALDIVQNGTVHGLDGQSISLRADTICIHGDTAGADTLARTIRNGLIEAGVRVTPLDYVND